MNSATGTATAAEVRRIEVAHLGSWILSRLGGRKCADFGLGILPPGAVAAATPQVADGCAASAADGRAVACKSGARRRLCGLCCGRAGGRAACEDWRSGDRERRKNGCLSLSWEERVHG